MHNKVKGTAVKLSRRTGRVLTAAPRTISGVLAAIALLTGLCGVSLVAQGSESVLLVINETSEDSRTIGEYYARRRGIPRSQVCRINTLASRSVSREVFEKEILEPVRHCISRNRLQDQILFIATTKGVPLVVEGQAGPVGDLASVDSELSMLYAYLIYGAFPTFGRVDNPYFGGTLGGDGLRPFDRRLQTAYLVTRLTAHQMVDAILLIDRGLEAHPVEEENASFVFDLSSQRRVSVLDWLEDAASGLRESGFAVDIERTAAKAPLRPAVLGYLQGRGQEGRFDASPVGSWASGSLAVAFDPSSAAGFSHDLEGDEGLSAPSLAAALIHAGATGVGGYVEEPTVDAYFRPQILFSAYLKGLNLAESFYTSSRYLSWREVVVGDPLASPYGRLSTDLRKKMKPCGTSVETGLPECFSDRRRDFLVDRYATSREAVTALLQGEGFFHQGLDERALEATLGSLELDPHIPETQKLAARLQERLGRYRESFEHYKLAVEYGGRSRPLYLKLAKLALNELDDPQGARPYAAILYRESSGRDPEVARLWASVEEALGHLEAAKSVYLRLLAAPASKLRAALELARLHLIDDDLETAQGFLDQAEDLLGEAPEAALQQRLRQLQEHISRSRAAAGDLPSQLPAPRADAGADGGATEAPAEQLSSSGVQPARVIQRSPTPYPDSARRAGIQGQVVLRLLIDELGQVLKSEAVHGHKTLVRAAQKSMLNWTFRPRLVNGRPEISYLTVALNFKIED